MTTPKTAIFHQILTVFPMYLLSCTTGLTHGWLPVAVYHLRSDKIITPEQGAWMASMLSFGRLSVALPGSIATDLIGRRKVCTCAGIIYALVWFALPFVSNSFRLLCVCNLLLGSGVALVNVANQMHMSEVVSASHRGSFHAVNGFYFNFGLLFIATIGVFLSYSTVCFVNGGVVLVYFIATYWLVESPYYLLMKGDHEQAEKNFQWLRTGIPEDEQREEFDKVKANVQFQQNQQHRTDGDSSRCWSSNILNDILKPLSDLINRRCLLVVLGLNLLDVQTGEAAVKLNSAFIFSTAKLIDNPVKYQFVISCVQFAGSFFSSFIIEKFKRRTLFITAALTVSANQLTNAVLFYVSEKRAHFHPSTIHALCLASTLLFYAIHTLTLHSLVNMQRCELLPQNVKAVGTGLAILVQSASQAVSILAFQYILQTAGIYPNFALFALFGILMAAFVYEYMPEIRGRTLAEIYESMSFRINNEN